MSLLKNYRVLYLKASSLLESVMAISIISICILIGTMTYAKVLETGNTLVFYKAKHRISKMLLSSSDAHFFEDNEYDYSSYKITKRIEKHPHNLYIRRVVFTIEIGAKSSEYSHILNYPFED